MAQPDLTESTRRVLIKTDQKILIIGNFFGNKKGRPTTQAEVLLSLLNDNGFAARGVSGFIPAFPRFVHQLLAILWEKWLQRCPVVIVEYYGSRVFYLQLLLILFAKFLHCRIIIDLHGGSVPDRPARLNDLCFLCADLIKAPSDYLKEFVESRGFSCKVIENVIDLPGYRIPTKKTIGPQILWMRAFQEAYDPVTAIRAFKLFHDQVPEANLTMAGTDLGQLASVKNLVGEMGLEGKVDFPGYLNHETKLDMARKCDLFLCSNAIDNTPVSLIEMMAMGLLVVSTDAGGIPYLLKHKETALLSGVGDEVGLCKNLLFAMKNASSALRMTEKARKFAKRFDAKQVAPKWIEALSDMDITVG